MRIIQKRRLFGRLGAILSLASVLVVSAFLTGGASARTARVTAAPTSTSAPVVTGQVREGRTLTTSNGSWNNNPTSFSYQWQQCDNSSANCTAIAGATAKTYTVASGDVDHKLRSAVTATNADGSATAMSQVTDIVSSDKAPNNTASPSITGTAKVGEELTAQNGTWTGGVKSFSYQWQRCDSSGGSCSAVPDATAKAYGVRTADSGNTIRVVVTATNAAGSSNATSGPTSVVGGGSTPPPTPVAGNKAPTISFVGLKRVGIRVYARFNLCDDGSKNITVIERDLKAGKLAYTRRFSVAPHPCGQHSRSWQLAMRFRGHGRYTATLRAVDKSGKSSRTVSRSLFFHGAL